MAHWFDDLAKTVSRSSVFGGLREAARRGSNEFALVQSADTLTVQNGPCGLRRAGTELTQLFSTQASTSDGQLLSYTANTTYDLERGTGRSTAVVQRGATTLLELHATNEPDEPQTFSIIFGSGFGGIREIRGAISEGRLEGMSDGHSLVSMDLAAPRETATPREDLRFVDGTAMPEGTVSADLLDELRDLSAKAQREMPSCVQFPESFAPLASSFPGCDDCLSACQQKENGCALEALKKAIDADCGVFIGVCLFYYGGLCLSDAADCYSKCKNPPGVCCPKRCERNGFAACCAPDGTCCGARCCPGGQVCADARRDLCCGPGSGPPCGTHCCPPGFKCAAPHSGFCCAEDAGEFCTKIWNEEQWEPACCPPNQVCADSSIGLCCPRDHGPVCAGRCCRPGEICRSGECCEPRLLCGDGERATCCPGECRNGKCCRLTEPYCGDECCPVYNECCEVQGRMVCCGHKEVCSREGCCPDGRVCGRRCCPPGHRCEDYDAEACIACPGDYIGCVSSDEAGRPRSMCCPPSVTCCVDQCCAYGETCCAPGGMPAGCYPPEFCLH